MPVDDMATVPLSFLWLEITGKCQLACEHCYADSGPMGTHGAMSEARWRGVIDEARGLGVRMIQFIGGEPTLHPSLPVLMSYALDREIPVEVFTNLVRVSERIWAAFSAPGVRLATSYYSPQGREHNAITGRSGSQASTLANIRKAVNRGIPLRVGVVGVRKAQRVDDAAAELTGLGIADLGVDYLRQVGRGVRDQAPEAAQLCGKCTLGTLAVSPSGDAWPCVFARWLRLGNVIDRSLADIYTGPAAAAARSELDSAFAARSSPNGSETRDCGPRCNPSCDPRTCQPSCPPRCGPTCNPIACQPRECWPSYEDRGSGVSARVRR